VRDDALFRRALPVAVSGTQGERKWNQSCRTTVRRVVAMRGASAASVQRVIAVGVVVTTATVKVMADAVGGCIEAWSPPGSAAA